MMRVSMSYLPYKDAQSILAMKFVSLECVLINHAIKIVLSTTGSLVWFNRKLIRSKLSVKERIHIQKHKQACTQLLSFWQHDLRGSNSPTFTVFLPSENKISGVSITVSCKS